MKKEKTSQTMTELKEQMDILGKAIQVEQEKNELQKKLEEQKKEFDLKLESIKKQSKVKKVQPEKMDYSENYFKVPEKKSLFNPISWFGSSDKTNPVVMVILSPAGDLTIRERVADQRGNLKLSKGVLYRIEHREIWDIAESEVTGFRGKRILFYFQDNPNPLRIRRDDSKVKVTVNTETYSKSQKSHLLSELLSPDMTFTDFISMIMMGVTIVLNIVIIFKLFFMKGG